MTLLDGSLRAVAAGAPLFADTLTSQGVPVQPVDWTPPANGDAELAAQLGSLWTSDIDRANAQALQHVLDARQVLVDVRPAGEVIPGLERDMILHAGPPIDWSRMTAPIRAAAVGAM
ncbi:MAG: hypothetical protein JO318_05310, partial [Chloroflexi bacterium]|nr:hypothetical protein [Chloroflexota bacterium]